MIRLGLVKTTGVPNFMDVQNDGSEDGQCRFGHTYRRVADWTTDAILKAGMSCTIKGYSQHGVFNPDSGIFTGLVGAIQTGDIDVSVTPVYYPVIDPDESIEYSSLVYEDTMAFLCNYNMTFGNSTKDILWMYNGIRYDVWMLLFLAFVIYALTFYHGQRLLRGKMNPRAVWTVMSAFIDQDNFSINWNDEKHSRFFIVWSLVMSIGLFFSINYLNNCACTDLVVYTKPWAPVSYQDILDHHKWIGMGEVQPEYQKFHDAPSGSMEAKLFKNVRKLEFSPTAGLKYQNDIISQKGIFLGRKRIAEIFALFFIQIIVDSAPYCRALVTQDEAATKYTNTFIMNKYTTPEKGKVIIEKLIQRGYEHGPGFYMFEKLYHDYIKRILRADFFAFDFMTPSVSEKETDIHPVGLENSIQLFSICFFLFLFACIIFFLEKWAANISKEIKVRPTIVQITIVRKEKIEN